MMKLRISASLSNNGISATSKQRFVYDFLEKVFNLKGVGQKIKKFKIYIKVVSIIFSIFGQ